MAMVDRRSLEDLDKAIVWKYVREMARTGNAADADRASVRLLLGRRDEAQNGARPLAFMVDFGKFDFESYKRDQEANKPVKRRGSFVVPLEKRSDYIEEDGELIDEITKTRHNLPGVWSKRSYFYTLGSSESNLKAIAELSELSIEDRDKLFSEVTEAGFLAWAACVPRNFHSGYVECRDLAVLLLEWAAAGSPDPGKRLS